MRPLILTLLFILLVGVDRSAAFIFTLSPDKSAVIVKVSNPCAQQTACTVTYNFITSDCIKTVTCTQTVPGGAKDWYVCIRPAAGKSYGNLDSGRENCTKPYGNYLPTSALGVTAARASSPRLSRDTARTRNGSAIG